MIPSESANVPADVPAYGHLLARTDLLRLLAVRLFGQFSDGVFQATLASAVLFNPERQAHAADIAAGFAVLLLPYSILGPFAGVLLDKWWRQRVLLGANLTRAVLVCGVAVEIAGGLHGQPFYLSALAVISVNRFVLSALSASLPHVVEPERLITANALSVTSGAIVTALGGAVAIGLRSLSNNGDRPTAVIALGAAVSYLIAGLWAHGFDRRQLGPDDQTRSNGETVGNVLGGLVAGARHVRSHPSVVRAFGVISLHRFGYGVTTITTLLLYRNYFTDDGFFRAGLTGLGQIVAATAVGGCLASIVTPAAVRRLGYTRWPALLLILAGVVEWVLGLPFQMQTFLPAAALLGFTAQGVKICVDTLVAQRVDDDFRGRVFSLYDTLFNVLFVGAGVLTALILPETGKSATAVIVIGAGYLVTGCGYWLSGDIEGASPGTEGPGLSSLRSPRTRRAIRRPPGHGRAGRVPSGVRADVGMPSRPADPAGSGGSA